MQTNVERKLLGQHHQVEMMKFPKLNSHYPDVHTLSKHENQHQNNQIPQIFTLGGNKQLNISLFKNRKQKLKKLEQTIPIIQTQQLAKKYQLQGDQEVVALKNITLKGSQKQGGIKKGEFVIIRGPSGGGKTTFLNLLGTIDKSTHGNIWIDNDLITQNHDDKNLSKLRRDKIGIVFQTFNLLALMTAYENIELPMRIKGEDSQKYMKDRTKMLLKRVGLMQRAQHLPSQLSGGQQQRVAIARSLANSPSIILLDEPTGDLDSKATCQIMNLLLQINNYGYNVQDYKNGYVNQGITIVMVTHNDDLECYGDRVIFFQDGKIKKQVFNDYQFGLNPEEYSQYLNTKV